MREGAVHWIDWPSEEHACAWSTSGTGSSRGGAFGTPSRGSGRSARGWCVCGPRWSRSSVRTGCSSSGCAAFGGTLVAGLAVMFGAHGFVVAMLLNIWFFIALVLGSNNHNAHASSQTWGQVLACAGGRRR